MNNNYILLNSFLQNKMLILISFLITWPNIKLLDKMLTYYPVSKYI